MVTNIQPIRLQPFKPSVRFGQSQAEDDIEFLKRRGIEGPIPERPLLDIFDDLSNRTIKALTQLKRIKDKTKQREAVVQVMRQYCDDADHFLEKLVVDRLYHIRDPKNRNLDFGHTVKNVVNLFQRELEGYLQPQPLDLILDHVQSIHTMMQTFQRLLNPEKDTKTVKTGVFFKDLMAYFQQQSYLRPRSQKPQAKSKLEWQMDDRVNRYQAQLSQLDLYVITENLLTNAAKYAPNGKRVAVQFTPENLTPPHSAEGSPKKRFLVLSVTDDGIGIPPHDQANVVNGGRASNAVQSQIFGTGYGLRRCRELLEAAGGWLRIQSPVSTDPQKPGTRIDCFIPASLKRAPKAL